MEDSCYLNTGCSKQQKLPGDARKRQGRFFGYNIFSLQYEDLQDSLKHLRHGFVDSEDFEEFKEELHNISRLKQEVGEIPHPVSKIRTSTNGKVTRPKSRIRTSVNGEILSGPLMEFFQSDDDFQEFERVFETVKSKKRFSNSMDSMNWSSSRQDSREDRVDSREDRVPQFSSSRENSRESRGSQFSSSRVDSREGRLPQFSSSRQDSREGRTSQFSSSRENSREGRTSQFSSNRKDSREGRETQFSSSREDSRDGRASQFSSRREDSREGRTSQFSSSREDARESRVTRFADDDMQSEEEEFNECHGDDTFSDFFDNDSDFMEFERELETCKVKRRSKVLDRINRNSGCDIVAELKALCDKDCWRNEDDIVKQNPKEAGLKAKIKRKSRMLSEEVNVEECDSEDENEAAECMDMNIDADVTCCQRDFLNDSDSESDEDSFSQRDSLKKSFTHTTSTFDKFDTDISDSKATSSTFDKYDADLSDLKSKSNSGKFEVVKKHYSRTVSDIPKMKNQMLHSQNKKSYSFDSSENRTEELDGKSDFFSNLRSNRTKRKPDFFSDIENKQTTEQPDQFFSEHSRGTGKSDFFSDLENMRSSYNNSPDLESKSAKANVHEEESDLVRNADSDSSHGININQIVDNKELEESVNEPVCEDQSVVVSDHQKDGDDDNASRYDTGYGSELKDDDYKDDVVNDDCQFTCHHRCYPSISLDCKSVSQEDLDDTTSAETSLTEPADTLTSDLGSEATNEKDETDSGYRSGTIPEDKLPRKPSQATLNREELRRRIDEYNDSVPVANFSLRDERGDTFQGFIRVTLNLVRPISMSLGARPPSIYEILTKEHIVEENTEAVSFYMPRDTKKSIHILSEQTTKDVITSLLKKFHILDNPRKFAMYEQELNKGKIVKLRRIGDKESPLAVTLNWDTTQIHKFRLVLQENETGEIVWEAFSTPELNNFLRVLEKEEDEYKQQLKYKYNVMKRIIKQRLKEIRKERRKTATLSTEVDSPISPNKS
ncbi:hypothetical protein ScPMuIL_008861 [Solemya velum]